jgi:hypothetical protein
MGGRLMSLSGNPSACRVGGVLTPHSLLFSGKNLVAGPKSRLPRGLAGQALTPPLPVGWRGGFSLPMIAQMGMMTVSVQTAMSRTR